MTTFHSLKVARVEPETRDAVTITFAIPQALQAEYCFRPGQHLTLKARLGGEELRRCYSICRSRTPGEISVAVKAIDGGRFSRYAQHDIQQGMELEVMVPQGHFGYQPQAERQGEYLAIAAGSGITPMMAIISATLATEPQSRFTLIYGNRSSHSMMFRQALADLKDRYPQRLQVIHLFSQESMDSDLLQGRIDGDKLRQLADHLLDFSRFDEAFICGPAAMMDEAEATLRELGVAEKSIHLERFNTPGGNVKRVAGVQAEGRTVTIRQDGRDRLIALSAEDDSILDAALRQGADLPFACKGGVCATCKCKVLRGEVAMAANYSLEADELAAGYVLSCQSLPTSGDVVVDFDARNNALLTQIAEALEAAAVDDSVGVCVIRGNARFFAAGADLNEMAEKDLPATLDDIRPRLWGRIDAFTKPLIASVNGYALGAGCELALLCDLIVAGDNARFGLPEITLGIMPGAGGTQRLIRSVGKALASRMVLSGESIDARQAQQAGLVSDIHPAALTDEYALKLATTIARHSPLALRAAKQSLRLAQEVSLQAGLQQERQLFSLLSATEDRREGIDAFLQKRTPEFKGR